VGIFLQFRKLFFWSMGIFLQFRKLFFRSVGIFLQFRKSLFWSVGIFLQFRKFFPECGNFHPHPINHYISTNYAHASWVWVKTTGPSVYMHYLPPEYTSCTAFRIYGQYSVYTKNVCLQYKYTVSTEKTPCKPFKGCMSFDTHLR
jgi:hypothetical protein